MVQLPWEMRSNKGDSFCQIFDLTGFQNAKLICLVMTWFVTEVSNKSTGKPYWLQPVWITENSEPQKTWSDAVLLVLGTHCEENQWLPTPREKKKDS